MRLRRTGSLIFRDLAEADRNGTLGLDAYAAAAELAGITWLRPHG
jgi:hypothetical protein